MDIVEQIINISKKVTETKQAAMIGCNFSSKGVKFTHNGTKITTVTPEEMLKVAQEWKEKMVVFEAFTTFLERALDPSSSSILLLVPKE